jgi:hypothetical protein
VEGACKSSYGWKETVEGKGTITVKDVMYTVKVTSNQRKAVYVKGQFVNTKPYNYDELE